jgi:O-antigen/teichoic acid export membrane protein
LSLVSLPLLVHALGVAEFGRYIAALALVSVFALAAEAGLTAVSLREFGRLDAADRHGRLAPLLGLRAALATAGVAIAVVVAAAIGWEGRIVAGTALAGVAALAQVWIDFAVVGLTGSLRFGRATAVDLVRAGLATGAIVVLALADAPTLPFFAAYAGAAVVAAGVASVLARRLVALRPVLDGAQWKEIARTVAPYALAAAVYVVHFRIVVILVAVEAPAREAGYFATSFRAVEFVVAVAGVAAAGAVPYLARRARDAAGFARSARSVVGVGVLAAICAALAVLVLAAVVVDVVAGDAGKPAAAVLRIQSLSVLGTLAAFAGGAVLLAAGRYRTILYVNLAGLIVTVALAAPLVAAHGARGGAIAAAAGDLCLFAFQLGALRSILGRRP